MADGRKTNGGRRPGAGRKSKAEEFGLQALLDKCWTVTDREKCIKQLARAANDPLSGDRMDAVKLLMSYAYGKPIEHKEVTGEDGAPLKVIVEYVGRNENTQD